MPQRRVLWRHRIGLRDLAEKRFHLPGWRKPNQNAPLPLSDKGPYVWNTSRCKQGVARSQHIAGRSYLKRKLAFNHVKPLILIPMQVPCGASAGVKSVLQDQYAAAIRWNDLEGDCADAKATIVTEAVVAGCNQYTVETLCTLVIYANSFDDRGVDLARIRNVKRPPRRYSRQLYSACGTRSWLTARISCVAAEPRPCCPQTRR